MKLYSKVTKHNVLELLAVPFIQKWQINENAGIEVEFRLFIVLIAFYKCIHEHINLFFDLHHKRKRIVIVQHYQRPFTLLQAFLKSFKQLRFLRMIFIGQVGSAVEP